MEIIHIRDEYIKLGQAMKLAGMVGSGVDAKIVIQDGLVKVNGVTQMQRGKKIKSGDIITYNGESVQIG
ncbi:ribosome-associated protein [uncultured Roseburia sp.]|uniref:RNA-binding S4 domain-containing protein n=1 Tax=Brotonthovivens ammoniilytica TaxID=2981725 RepID=A0ABT2THD6_9FIRM|nr:RNA-binding S4 domain-containing protein [Brotonthovivens ammoniilytica]MCU6761593.1 RNA-binding S4 domain-containing protein [Brotonthovivens ammoniilytica]SCI40793.1 ribosome-associated protein [uncultured Roseburia sp.]